MEVFRGFVANVDAVCAVFGIVGALAYTVVRVRARRPLALHDLLLKSVGTSAIPTGVALLVCAVEPRLLTSFSSVNVHILVAGLAVLFLAYDAWRTEPPK